MYFNQCNENKNEGYHFKAQNCLSRPKIYMQEMDFLKMIYCLCTQSNTMKINMKVTI